MKRSVLILMTVAIVAMITARSLSAQLIDWERRKSNKAIVITPNDESSEAEQTSADTGESEVEESEVSEAQSESDENFVQKKGEQAGLEGEPTHQEMKSEKEILVTNRIERIYDLNRDGRLQVEEKNAFIEDVIAAIKRRGSFFVSSKILREFDKNDDGKIDREEMAAMAIQKD